MKIELNEEEMKKAIALYIREKCVSQYNSWEIANIALTHDDNEFSTTVTIDANDPSKNVPSPVPCAPQTPRF